MHSGWVVVVPILGLLSFCACSSLRFTPVSGADADTACRSLSDSAYHHACIYLFNEAQPTLVAGPEILAVKPEDVAGVSADAIKQSRQPSKAGKILRAEVTVDKTVAATVNQAGVPAALELDGQSYFALYYLAPPRSYLFPGGSVVELKEVPQSIRRIALNQEPRSPWPVIFKPDGDTSFAAPQTPDDPPAALNRQAFAGDAGSVRRQLTETSNGEDNARAQRVLRKLAPGARIPGVQWQLVVFRRDAPQAFAVPNGTLFVSDGLVRSASDNELAAVIAHLMGHVRYGHYRIEPPAPPEPAASHAQESDASGHQSEIDCAVKMAKFETVESLAAGLVGLATMPQVAVAMGPAALLNGPVLALGTAFIVAPIAMIAHPQDICRGDFTGAMEKTLEPREAPPGPAAPVKPFVDVRNNERQANYAAAGYLRRASIAPESLFDAMMKVKMSQSHAVSSSNDSRTDFEAMQNHGDNGAADFGRMLDAGQVSDRAP